MIKLKHFARLLPVAVLGALAWFSFSGNQSVAEESKAEPIRALFLTGGCCHDYDKQKVIIPAGISERANVKWKVIHEGGKGTKHQYDELKREGWEKDYDVVIYNICFAHDTGKEYIESIAKKHHDSGLGAVALHCTYHSYHWKVGTDKWEELLGVTSPRHGKKHPITMKNLKPEHPIMKGFKDGWVTPQGELYHVKKTWPTAIPLASGTIDGGKSSHECVWLNNYGKAKIFGTTVGHHNETMAADEYLDLVSRGLLYVTGNLDENGKAKPGYGPAK